MAKGVSGGGDGIGNSWYRLTPDANGSYVNGTWTTLAPMHDTRLYFSTRVLKDARVFVAGGEYGTGSYGSGSTAAEIYDPVTNTWTQITPPASLLDPSLGQGFVDCDNEILPDGRVLVAPVSPNVSGGTLIYDPSANIWSAGPVLANNASDQDEASWVKLPDSSILTIDPFGENGYSERYIPSTNTWISDSTVPVNLYDPGLEMGAGLLLPNGNAFFLGSTGATVFYTPSGSMSPGVWTTGPTIPNSQGTPDAPAAMMVNGKVLCAVSPIPTGMNNGLGGCSNPEYPCPTSFYEYDYSTNAFAQVNGPTGTTDNHPSYSCLMLDLPDGTVLYTNNGRQLYVYQPFGSPLAAGKPTINTISKNDDGSYHLTGTMLNGISEGAAYGDDAQMATNYPIVRLSDASERIYYARTYNWSDTGVMAGSTSQTTEFTLPTGLPSGTYSLVVVANGIASDLVSFTTINFDSIDASANPVGGAVLDSYLSPYGVTISNVTLNSQVVVDDDRRSYGGGVVFASSPHNFLSNYFLNAPNSFTLNFATPLTSVNFTRIAGGPNPTQYASWTGTALDGSGNAISSVSEDSPGTSDFPAKTFTLYGSNIAAVRWDSDGHGTAAFAAVLLDDLVLTSAPTPSYTISVAASPGMSGTVAGGGSYAAGSNVSAMATANTGYSFVNWTENGSVASTSASYTFTVMSNRVLVANFAPTIQITVQTNPVGLSVIVDGTTYTSPQIFSWASGSSHTIATTSPQDGGTGVRYGWSKWSDSKTISHTVTPTKNTTYTATFTQQYYLTMTASTGGTISPASGWKNSGAAVSISATPTNNASVSYNFASWTGNGAGSYSGTNNPAAITMNGPITETAAFTQNPVQVTVQTNPAGPTFMVDSTTYTAAQTFSWQPGSSHTIATTSPQSGGTGVQYVWRTWSDNGAISLTVAPTKNTTYTANFTTQYYLTMSAGTGGGVTPSSGWRNSGATVSISAIPTTGYTFINWTGSGIGSYTGSTNPSSITMGSPITETAAFTR